MSSNKIGGFIALYFSLFFCFSAQASNKISTASLTNCDGDGRCFSQTALTVSVSPRSPRVRAHNSALRITRGWATIRSKKTGATAYVAYANQAAFQSYIDDIESAGAIVKFMGGVRNERCAPPRHKHACGGAVDVCQKYRDVVDGICHLPSRKILIAIAARHSLTEGGQWCHGDRGHVEAGPSAGACGVRMTRYRVHRHLARAL